MPINGAFTPYDMDRLTRAISYIEKNYQDAISADSLSVEVSMDIKHLQTGIQLITGMTVHNFQLKVRVDRALVDLADFARSIKSIAFKHGFSSPSHFGTEFKKRIGMNPKKYRFQLMLNGNHLHFISKNKEKNYPAS
jgi:AraC family transcriptional regulator